MFITLAYSNEIGYEYDLKAAFTHSPMKVTIFEMEVANTSALNPASGMPFQSKLLDGQMWELAVKVTGQQKIATLPNLMLAGTKINNVFITYKDLVNRWYYARSRWIATDELMDVSQIKKLAKVVRMNETLEFEQVDGITWAQRTTIEIQTAGVNQP